MSLSELSEEELIARIKKAKRASGAQTLLFEELWLRYWGPLDRFVRRSAGELATVVDHDDIRQKVIERVYDKIETYEGKGSFAAWLARVVERITIDTIRAETGLRKLFALDLAQEIEEVLEAGTIPESLILMFVKNGVNFAEIPELQKQGEDWLISPGKRTKTGKGTWSKYIARRNGDRLDIYRCSSKGKPMVGQWQPQEDQSDYDLLSRQSVNVQPVEPVGDDPVATAEGKMLSEALSRAFAAKAKLGPRELKCARATILIYRKGWTKEQVARLLRTSGTTLNTLLHENELLLQEMLAKPLKQQALMDCEETKL